MAKPVTLTELEFTKLMRLQDRIGLSEAHARVTEIQAKIAVAEAVAARMDYFSVLKAKYPELEPTVPYRPVEDTFTLEPQESK
jgi:hypothetical protein